MRKRLIVNADDFGPNPRIVEAIVLAARTGALTSTSVLVNLTDVSSAVAQLSRSGIGIGVHLNATTGRPLSAREDIATLVNAEGAFLGREHFRSRKDLIDPAQLRIEFTAQINHFRTLGLEPTHLDNHHPEIYLHPDLFQVVIDLAQQLFLPIRVPLSADLSPLTAAIAAKYGMTAKSLAAIGADIRARCASAGVRHPEVFFPALDSRGTPGEAMMRFLEELPEGTTELCLHLGDESAVQRREFAAITTLNLRPMISSLGIELVDFTALSH